MLKACVAVLFGLTASMAVAGYPEQRVSIIVPVPPGVLEDDLNRMIAEDFQNEYGVPTAVLHKPGSRGGPFPGAVEIAETMKASDPLDLSNTLGAVHSEAQLLSNLRFIDLAKSEGNNIVEGGTHILADTGGFYMSPTVSFGQDPQTALERQSIPAKWIYVKLKHKDIAHTLLECVDEHRAEILVIGAFEHSNFREDLFGGVTLNVMAQTKIPNFLAYKR